MHRHFTWTVLALAAGLTAAHAADPLDNCTVQGVFQPGPDGLGEGAVHPLPPCQRLTALQDGATFRVQVQGNPDPLAFPVLAEPGAQTASAPPDLDEHSFIAAVDLTGRGVSDLIYTSRSGPGWKVLSNGTRLPKPVQGFVVGYYDASGARKTDHIPADNREFRADHDLLCATGDFLGTGAEQFAYTRPGNSQLWLVGAHGVISLKADLAGVEPNPGDARVHWLFPYKANRKGQRTRLAYYRMGADRLLRLVPKGMEFQQEQVPLKGHWEHLNQATLDWPRDLPAEAAQAAKAAAQ